MDGQQIRQQSGDQLTTIFAVVASTILVGHAASLFPDRPATGWVSAAAFTALVFLYAVFTAPGRRSGFRSYAIGAAATAPAWLLWLIISLRFDEASWYVRHFSHFRIGLSDRGWGHAGEVWMIVWSTSLFLMILVALVARGLVLSAAGRR